MGNTPNIRFKGFTDDWEQRKLIDYLEVSSEKNRDNRFTKDDVLSVSGEYGIVNQIEFQGRSFAGASVSNYGVVENGDVVYTKSPLKSNPYGIIKTNKGIPGIVSTLYAVYKPKEITDSKFVQIYFELDSRMNSYMHPLVNKGAKNDMKVSAENALKGMVSFPKKDEQEMISLYFSSLDNLIALHQRKCDETKKLKKFMLQKMFPKKNEKKPEIRFAGFTDDWEQRKLSECAGFRRGSFPQPYGNKEWYDGEGAMPFVQVADVADDMKLVDDTKQKISKLAQPMSVYADKGSVLVTLQGSIGRVAITQYGAFVDRTVLIFDKYNQDIDKTFWAYIIKEKFIDEARKAPGGTIKTITKEALSDFDLMLPNYDEQKKLGAFLVSIDNLITLHQRKCDEIKEIKKFMLQNKFPQKG